MYTNEEPRWPNVEPRWPNVYKFKVHFWVQIDALHQ